MTADSPRPIPVVCDRCRAEGLAGEDPFEAFGALLDFEPVPRRTARSDGWDAATQRAYVAALSLTGSDRAACRAVGRSAFGITQLLAHEGSEGFRAAREQAMAIAGGERSRRLGEGVRAVAAEQSGWRPADPPWARAASRHPPAPDPGPDPAPDESDLEEAKLDALDRIACMYMAKVEQERVARLAGRIVEADFYLRQMTWLEVALDLASGDGLRLLRDFRAKGCHLVDIAESPMSELLGRLRREEWAELGEPPRPEHPPRRYLEDQGGFATEPLEHSSGGLELGHDEQRRAFEERHRAEARAQIEWEARARRDYEERSTASKADGT